MKPTHSIFDTETSGLFNFALPADDPSQPRLASISMFHLDASRKTIGEFHRLVKPDGWELSAEAASVNKLTMERLHDEGVPVREVLDYYTDIVHSRSVIVAFNAQYDCKVMRSELRRAGRDDLFMITKNICLMRGAHSAGVPKPEGSRGFPKLEHALAHFGCEVVTDRHTAPGDAAGALALFLVLGERDLLPEAAVHFAKNHPNNAAKAPKAKRKPSGPASALDEIPA